MYEDDIILRKGVFPTNIFLFFVCRYNEFMKFVHPKSILIYTIIVTGLLFLVENIYHPVYILQLLQKICSFLLIPILVASIFKETVGKAGSMSRF